MGTTAQIVILICFLFWSPAAGFCLSEDDPYGYYQPDEKLEILQVYFEAEMYEPAAALLNDLLAEFPDEPRFKYLQALIFFQTGKIEQAEKGFVEFIKQYPEVEEPYYILAQINLNRDNQEAARQYLKTYCTLVPEDFGAQAALDALSESNTAGAVLIKDAEENLRLVKRLRFNGACIYGYSQGAIKLIDNSSSNAASMGVDLAKPVDLRGKKIKLKVRGQQGGEKFSLVLRDSFAQDNQAQLVLEPADNVTGDWKDLEIAVAAQEAQIDLSQIIYLGFEFGQASLQNPAPSTLFLKDITIQ